MEKVERAAVFETNSSSTHSITISSGDYTIDTMPVDKDGLCEIYPGEFGWEIADYYDSATKASYCLTWCKACGSDSSEYEEMLKSVIADKTGAKSIEFIKSDDEYSPWGYIDHQSDGVCSDAFVSKKALTDFIFNPSSELHTDNDNH